MLAGRLWAGPPYSCPTNSQPDRTSKRLKAKRLPRGNATDASATLERLRRSARWKMSQFSSAPSSWAVRWVVGQRHRCCLEPTNVPDVSKDETYVVLNTVHQGIGRKRAGLETDTERSKYFPDETERAQVPLGHRVMRVARNYGPCKTFLFGNKITRSADLIRERRGLLA